MLEYERPDIIATNAFYYYHDVEAAWIFYRDTLGRNAPRNMRLRGAFLPMIIPGWQRFRRGPRRCLSLWLARSDN